MMRETDRNAFRDDASFLDAFFFGSIVAVLPSSFVLLPAVVEGRISVPGTLWVSMWCFAGGFLSSLTIRVGLHFHAWGFLRLLAASPALPVWVFTVFALLMGLDPDQSFLSIVFVLCGVSVIGSMTGYRYRDTWRERLVNSRIWYSLKGPMAGVFICLLLFAAGGVLLEETRSKILPQAVSWFFALVVPPLLGGLVAGAVGADALPHARRPHLLLAAMSPVIPFLGAWFLWDSLQSFPKYGKGLAPPLVCAAALALAFLGGLIGYLDARRKRRPPRTSVLYGDPGVPGTDGDDDG